jgi:hypothetical protein
MLIWHAGAENEASTFSRCSPKAAVGEDTNVSRKVPRVDARLAPQALDLLDDEPRMIKEALAGRG